MHTDDNDKEKQIRNKQNKTNANKPNKIQQIRLTHTNNNDK